MIGDCWYEEALEAEPYLMFQNMTQPYAFVLYMEVAMNLVGQKVIF